MATFKITSQAPDVCHIFSRLFTPYHTLSSRLKEKHFHLATLKLVPKLQFYTTTYHVLSLLITPYLQGWKENHFHFATLKLNPKIKILSHLASGVENSFADRITRMSFYPNYYQLFIHGKFLMNEKKLLIVGPPGSGKASWFAPFQSMLTNVNLLFQQLKNNSFYLFRNTFH